MREGDRFPLMCLFFPFLGLNSGMNLTSFHSFTTREKECLFHALSLTFSHSLIDQSRRESVWYEESPFIPFFLFLSDPLVSLLSLSLLSLITLITPLITSLFHRLLLISNLLLLPNPHSFLSVFSLQSRGSPFLGVNEREQFISDDWVSSSLSIHYEPSLFFHSHSILHFLILLQNGWIYFFVAAFDLFSAVLLCLIYLLLTYY